MKNSRNGYCECGCGELAPIYKRTDMRIGSKAGTPAKFIVGHQARKSVSPECGYIVDIKTGCWNWALAKGRDGYGKVKVGGRTCRSHIVEWAKKERERSRRLVFGPSLPKCSLRQSFSFGASHASRKR